MMASRVTLEYEIGKRTNFKKSRIWAATPVYKMQIATYGVKTEERERERNGRGEGPLALGCRA